MYESYFGLKASPFQLSPDPSFLFASTGHRRAHAYLQHAIRQGEGFIVVTGEIGAGKTTLVRVLIEEIGSQPLFVAQLLSTRLDADAVLHALAAALGLLPCAGGKAEVLAGIETFLVGLAARGRRALLVVDEAQNLTPQALEELRLLSNLERKRRPLLQSLLVGQPELRERMRASSMERLRQRILASFHLGPLEEAETRAYVEHRLGHAGWQGDPAISATAFVQIHQATGGIPRRINALCKRLLLGAYLAERHEIGPEQVAEALVELRSELDPEAYAEGPAAAAPGAGRSEPTSAAIRPGARTGTGVRPYMMSAITARLDRIEQGLEDMLERVRVLAGAKERPAVPKKSVVKVAARASSGSSPPARRR